MPNCKNASVSDHSDLTENDNTIATIHGSLLYYPVSTTNRMTSLLNPKRVDFHMAFLTLKKEWEADFDQVD